MKKNSTPVERFWDKVDLFFGVTDEDCWEWKASLDVWGYGQFAIIGKHGKKTMGKAHRFSYELHKGKIPDGMFICHTCDCPSCVNPHHLFAATPKQNTHDMISKGRKVFWSKLTESAIAEIRAIPDFIGVCSMLGKKHNVTPSNISYIRNNKSWKNIQPTQSNP